MTDLWNYRCRVERVVDGDTVDVYIDAGFHTYRVERIRIKGVDCPERKDAEAWQEATSFVRMWFYDAYLGLDLGMYGEWPLIIHTEKADAFGRYLGTITRVCDGADLATAIIEGGHGVVWSRS